MTEAEEIYLSITSYANYSEMNGIKKEWILKCIDKGLKAYHEAQLKENVGKIERTAYLMGYTDGKNQLKAKMPSDEEMKKLVERIAYTQMGEEQIDDLIAKMGLLDEWLKQQIEQ